MDKIQFLSDYFKKYATAVEVLKEPNEESLSNMEDIEKIFDERYGYGWSQDREGILNDLLQKDAVSVTIKDDNGIILGYVYGYKCSLEDIEDAEEELDEIDLSEIKKLASQGKLFYIANLVVKPEVRARLLELLLRFKEEIKNKGYRYAVMEALSDSARLIFNDDGSIKERRLQLLNAKIEMVTDELDGRKLIFVKLL